MAQDESTAAGPAKREFGFLKSEMHVISGEDWRVSDEEVTHLFEKSVAESI